MRSLAALKTKANAKYTCQECGSTELIQAHHEIRGDDNSLIALCALCHCHRHPDLPRALFFNKRSQPYWWSKSAASLAKALGICSRTVIRAARKLNILPGELTAYNEELIRNNIPKLQPKQKDKALPKFHPRVRIPSTTIQLHRKTKNRLDELGSKGDTYEDIIVHLIEHFDSTAESNKGKKKEASAA